jgi:hypothetical protein
MLSELVSGSIPNPSPHPAPLPRVSPSLIPYPYWCCRRTSPTPPPPPICSSTSLSGRCLTLARLPSLLMSPPPSAVVTSTPGPPPDLARRLPLVISNLDVQRSWKKSEKQWEPRLPRQVVGVCGWLRQRRRRSVAARRDRKCLTYCGVRMWA